MDRHFWWQGCPCSGFPHTAYLRRLTTVMLLQLGQHPYGISWSLSLRQLAAQTCGIFMILGRHKTLGRSGLRAQSCRHVLTTSSFRCQVPEFRQRVLCGYACILRVETAQPFSHGEISGMLSFAMAMVLYEPVTFIKLSFYDKMTMRVCRCLVPNIGAPASLHSPSRYADSLLYCQLSRCRLIGNGIHPVKGIEHASYGWGGGCWFFEKRRMKEQGLSDMHSNGWW